MSGIEHGTYGGYQAHKRNGEGPCPDCRQANSTYQAAWRRRNPASQSLNAERQAARDRALRKLAERFPAELESLYAAELAALQLGGAGAVTPRPYARPALAALRRAAGDTSR